VPDFSLLIDLHVGGRTKPDAFAVVHDLKLRLAPGIIPAFIERVNLTFRQCVSSLSRRIWALRAAPSGSASPSGIINGSRLWDPPRRFFDRLYGPYPSASSQQPAPREED
jgi:hypothetical protein